MAFAKGIPMEQEVIYQGALAIEMEMEDLVFEREMEMEISYEGRNIGARRVDFFVDNKIMVELKAIIKFRRRTPSSSHELLPGVQSAYRLIDQLRSKKS